MPRIWATLGNIYRIGAVFLALAGLASGYGAVQRFSIVGADGSFQTQAFASGVAFVLAFIYWMIKPVLISNRPRFIGPIVRILVGGSYLVGWIFWLGAALTYYQTPGVLEILVIGALVQFLFLGIVYALTGEPAAYEYANTAQAPKAPKYKVPTNFQPSGRVGPSGATVYSDSTRTELTGHFDSYIPVQVTEERNGFSHVVAGTGQSGWIDSRTVGALN